MTEAILLVPLPPPPPPPRLVLPVLLPPLPALVQKLVKVLLALDTFSFSLRPGARPLSALRLATLLVLVPALVVLEMVMVLVPASWQQSLETCSA